MCPLDYRCRNPYDKQREGKTVHSSDTMDIRVLASLGLATLMATGQAGLTLSPPNGGEARPDLSTLVVKASATMGKHGDGRGSGQSVLPRAEGNRAKLLD
jgi:hypothetical protein